MKAGFEENISDMRRDFEDSQKRNEVLQIEMSKLKEEEQHKKQQQHRKHNLKFRTISVQTSLDYRNISRGMETKCQLLNFNAV